jgi:hypothetical protein
MRSSTTRQLSERASSRGSRATDSAFELTENEILRGVFAHLDKRARSGVFAFHPKNESSDMRGRRAGIYKALGVRSGIPDVIISKRLPGGAVLVFALELKRESRRGKRLTNHEKKQLQCREIMTECGWITGVAHGLDEALAWLENNFLLRGEFAAAKIVG